MVISAKEKTLNIWLKIKVVLDISKILQTGHKAIKSHMANVDQMRKGTKGEVKRIFVSV